MSGASYGGGIQLVTAAIDSRLDAIAPVIAWHSLVTSLYKAQAPKSGWGSALFALGVEGSTIPGIPAGETGNLDPHITSAYTSGLAYGQFSDEDVRWFAARGPGALVQRIRIPTLLIQGTVDTLFTLDEAITNYRILRANKVPSKMIWFCGGHGACLTDAGPAGYVEGQTVSWFERHLKRDKSVATGARFEWIADDGQVRTAPDYPPAVQQVASGSGAGLFALNPDAVSSGALIAATPSPLGIHVPLSAPAAGSQIVGPPKLTLSYSGLGTSSSAPVYAQIVDKQRNIVVGNEVTPIRLTLDGLPHTATFALEAIAESVESGSSYELQIVPATSVYSPQRVAGLIDMTRIELSLPVAAGRLERGRPGLRGGGRAAAGHWLRPQLSAARASGPRAGPGTDEHADAQHDQARAQPRKPNQTMSPMVHRRSFPSPKFWPMAALASSRANVAAASAMSVLRLIISSPSD